MAQHLRLVTTSTEHTRAPDPVPLRVAGAVAEPAGARVRSRCTTFEAALTERVGALTPRPVLRVV